MGDALEAQGLTLSQVEKLLPVIDELGLLPLAVKNKDLILSLAPFIVDTAFLGLPLAANVVGTAPSTYSTIGAVCFALAGYEGIAQGNTFLAVLLALLGTPAAILGSVLGQVFGDNLRYLRILQYQYHPPLLLLLRNPGPHPKCPPVLESLLTRWEVNKMGREKELRSTVFKPPK